MQAEHDSLQDYLLDNLTDDQRSRIAILSFDQWPWATAAVVEIAVAAHLVGSEVTVGLWADFTPHRGVGWTTNRTLARLSGSHSIEDSARKLIQAAGVPKNAFARPPLNRYSPALPDLRVPATRADIRRMTHKGASLGRAILQVHPNMDTPVREDYVWPRRWVKSAARSFAWVYDQTQALIQQHGLTSLVVFNGRFTHDNAAASAAEALGVKTLFFDYGGSDTHFDLTTASTHDWDYFQQRMRAMWDQWGADRESIARAWFTDRENHAAPGMEAFVGHQDRNYLPELPQAKRLVVFFSSSGDEIAELDLDWSEFFGSQEEALLALARICHELPDTELVVRTHPHMLSKPEDDRIRWIQAVNSIGMNAHIPPESPTDSYALMQRADRIITYGSTTGVEAAFRNKSVAVLGPCAYDLLGCAQPIKSADELAQWLEDPHATQPELALPYGLMMQRRGFNLSWLDQSGDGGFLRGDLRLEEAPPIIRKLSHRLQAARDRWLIAK